MIRALIYLLGLAALAVAAAWLADRPGEMVIDWAGYRIETSVFAGIVIIAGIVFTLFIFWTLARNLLAMPGRVMRAAQERRKERGREALRMGIFAVGAGDAKLAARYASEAGQVLSDEPLIRLLRAQTAQLTGDHATARRIFEAMADDDSTRLMGLHGLFLEARRANQTMPAEQFAAQALVINPALPWAIEALFELQCRRGDWQGALETLGNMRQHRLLERKPADRRRAVLLTAQAMELEQTDQNRAEQLAQEAHRLAPDLVPAAEIAGRVLASQGYTSRAAKILSRTWELSPHPDIALVYAYARTGDSPRERLNRVRTLTRTTPNQPEARLALAAAAVDAHEWDEARSALQPLLSGRPTRRTCTLMARIEAGDTRNAGRVREWLARALRAPRDPAWVADGVVSDQWAPTSPVTGRLDAFSWRAPVERRAVGESDALPAEIVELDRLEALREEQEKAAMTAAMQAVELAAKGTAVPGGQPMLENPGQPTAEPRRSEASGAHADEHGMADIPAAQPDKPQIVVQAPLKAETRQPETGQNVGQNTDQVLGEGTDQNMSQNVTRDTATPRAGETVPAGPAKPAASDDKPLAWSGQTTHQGSGTRAPDDGARHRKVLQPKIFVPDRPPDDPGPEPVDPDEPSDPYARFRIPAKAD
jgi:HemY protein